MIGLVKGKILSKNVESVQIVLATESLGYEITVLKPCFDRHALGDTLMLWTHTHVREDILQLYGFELEAEKQFFRVLLSVSGLGPRTALSLLSEHGPERLSKYILEKDTSSISEAPGVGKKLAERLILELGSKIEKMAWVTQLKTAFPSETAPAASPTRQMREDLSSALLNLGYPAPQVKNTLDKLFDREQTIELGFEASLRAALKEMSGRAGAHA